MSEEKQFVFDIIHETIGCKCIKCFNKYGSYNDPFIEVIDCVTNKKITFELCYDCIKTLLNVKCQICDRLLDEPWEQIYIDLISNMIKCRCCHNVSDKNYKKCTLQICKICSK